MRSEASTVEDYLASLPADRRDAIEQVRAMLHANLDAQIVENMSYGMIGYAVPLSAYPPGYHCSPDQPLPFLALASQKGYMALYMFAFYVGGDAMKELEAAWKKTGKKLDMGKSCLRFKRVEDLPLDLIGAAIRKMTVKRFLGIYEEARAANELRKAAKKQTTAKAATKKTAKK